MACSRLQGCVILLKNADKTGIGEMNSLLREILEKCSGFAAQGKVADYIPELSNANANHFGIAVLNENGALSFAGDYQEKFTMQSIVKPLILLLALSDRGAERVRELVGVEATGKPFDAFNYSDQALKSEHINPMINTGAIALCTLINGDSYADKFARLLALTRKMTGNPHIQVNERVYLSEKATGNKNRALAYMLKAYGMLDGDVEEIVDLYFRACSIEVDCQDLANVAFVLANHGKNVDTGEQIVKAEYARYVNAVLTTSGMYDGSGEFALSVGMPAKSGVGGGIMAVAPRRMGVGIYSPALDKKGNSVAGKKALELLSQSLNLSIF